MDGLLHCYYPIHLLSIEPSTHVTLHSNNSFVEESLTKSVKFGRTEQVSQPDLITYLN